MNKRIARSTAVRRGVVVAEATRRARGSAEETEQTLLEAARRAFGEKGYVRTTVQDIIAGTGLSRGAFYRYFRSTDDVFLKVVTGAIDEVIASSRVRTGETLRERVQAGNLRYLEIFRKHRGLMRAVFEARFVNTQIDEIVGRMRGAYLRRVRDHLARQSRLGHCHPLDPDAAALSLGMMVEGAAEATVVTGLEPFDAPLDLERLCTQITEIWCRAVYKDPDRRLAPAAAAEERRNADR